MSSQRDVKLQAQREQEEAQLVHEMANELSLEVDREILAALDDAEVTEASRQRHRKLTEQQNSTRFALLSEPLIASTRRLRARWTLESEQDLRRLHGFPPP